MNPLLAYRFELEILVICVALLFGLGWWTAHNKREQLIGASVCVNKYTITQAQGVADTDTIERQHAETLQRVVAAYDQKINALAANNDDLVQRMHDLAAANGSRTVPGIPAAADRICAASDPARLTARDRREAADLEACAKITLELNAMRQAWSDLAANQKRN